MKKLLIVCKLLLVAVVLSSCERNALDLAAPLSVSKTTSIQKGEPVIFSFNTEADTSRIEWKVSPNQEVSIINLGAKAKITFRKAGSYVVTATDQITTFQSRVTVDTSSYIPNDTSTVITPGDTISPPIDTVGTNPAYLSLANATFTLTPVLVDSANLGKVGLMLNIESDQTYNCLNSQLSYQGSPFSGTHGDWDISAGKLTLWHVQQPGSKFCEAGQKKVTGSAYVLYPVKEGISNLEVLINEKTYKGSITRTGNNYKIDWPDASVIKFSKASLTK